MKKITKKDVEKEPWLKAFTENVNTERKLTEEEQREIKEIRERMSSPVLRCIALKDNGAVWSKGDEVGIRECDIDRYKSMLKVIN